MSADDMLARMRAAKEKAETPKGPAVPVEEMYVRLLVSKPKRRQLGVALTIAFLVITGLLVRDMHIEKAWWLTGLPIAVIGLIITLVPLSEDWEYRPWQTRARQYERHQVER